jgi:GT2 family glycosyltransferase
MEPRVTIVVTQRERMSLTERSLESILADRSTAFDLIYVDGGAPEDVAAYLRRRSREADFRLIRREEWLWPNVARNIALALVTTPYVVFIDNDVLVEQGWLSKLVDAADETDAALVGPLYLWSDGRALPTIHMSGGILTFETTSEGLAIHERHDRYNEPVTARTTFSRQACDFLEYHCTLARTDFLRDIGGLDEQIVCVHEHIDLALLARQKNLPILTDPLSAVTYLAFVPMQVADLAFHRWRWSADAVASSLRAFSTKWKTVEGGPSFAGVLDFAARHRETADPLLPGLAAKQHDGPPTADISQTLYDLLRQATQRGYSRDQVLAIGKSYHAAAALFGDGFRPCGRPFMLHCTGTASVLVAHGFSLRVVIAGMLHAAYSHAKLGPGPLASLDALKRQLQAGFGDRVEAAIHRYAVFQADTQGWCAQRPLERLTLDDVETVAIAIANEIDEYTAGEFAFTAKRPLGAGWHAYAEAAADALGLPALGRALADASRTTSPEGFILRRPQTASYRYQDGTAVPMSHPHFAHWQTALNQRLSA